MLVEAARAGRGRSGGLRWWGYRGDHQSGEHPLGAARVPGRGQEPRDRLIEVLEHPAPLLERVPALPLVRAAIPYGGGHVVNHGGGPRVRVCHHGRALHPLHRGGLAAPRASDRGSVPRLRKGRDLGPRRERLAIVGPTPAVAWQFAAQPFIRGAGGVQEGHEHDGGQEKAVAVLPGGDASRDPGRGHASGPIALLDHAMRVEVGSRDDREDAGHRGSCSASERFAILRCRLRGRLSRPASWRAPGWPPAAPSEKDAFPANFSAGAANWALAPHRRAS